MGSVGVTAYVYHTVCKWEDVWGVWECGGDCIHVSYSLQVGGCVGSVGVTAYVYHTVCKWEDVWGVWV